MNQYILMFGGYMIMFIIFGWTMYMIPLWQVHFTIGMFVGSMIPNLSKIIKEVFLLLTNLSKSEESLLE